MIHIINFIFRCALTFLFGGVIQGLLLLLSLILWDKKFIEMGIKINDLIWD